MTDETPASGTPAGNGATPWYGASADPAFVGHLQNRGWDKLEPSAAAIAAATAHREAEKLIGGRAEDRLVMPKDAGDAEGWDRFNARIGVPKDVKEYDFSGVKFADGDPVGEEFATTMREVLQKAHVSKADAPEVVKAVVQYLEKSEAADAASQAEQLAAQRDVLRINWGANVDNFLTVARNTANTLGVTPEQVDALEKSIGYAAVMEMFRNIGSKIGEDAFITSNNGGGKPVPMTYEQAEHELGQLINDKTFYDKLQAGDWLRRSSSTISPAW